LVVFRRKVGEWVSVGVGRRIWMLMGGFGVGIEVEVEVGFDGGGDGEVDILFLSCFL